MAKEQDLKVTLDTEFANRLIAEYTSRNRSGQDRLNFAATLVAVAAQAYRDLHAMGAPIEDTKEAFALIAFQMYEYEQSRPKPPKA